MRYTFRGAEWHDHKSVAWDGVGPVRSAGVGNMGGGAELDDVSLLRVSLLGGFRVERADLAAPISGWQRRSAKTLTKLLATSVGHCLHREQIIELLWPGSTLESSLNSFGKALHAARRAFQPGLPPRQQSLYLLMSDSMVVLNVDHVVIDADHFEQVAYEAIRRREVGALEAALAAYTGDLLPEDRYADWCTSRRESLADLRMRLLLELADLLQARGAYNDAADRLRAVLRQDPTREEVHRRLMRLYAEMGTPDQAVRQFHACKEVLKREFDFSPENATIAVYHDVLAHRVSEPQLRPPGQTADSVSSLAVPGRPHTADGDPFVGRLETVAALADQLTGPREQGGLVILSGEPGVGKTRLVEELARTVTGRGAVVLWGGAGAHGTQFSCGPFALALEGYVAARPATERRELAQRYPPLQWFVPSLVGETQRPSPLGREDDLEVVPAIVRLLTEIAHDQPALLVLGDLSEADAFSLDVLAYVAHLAVDRRWLVVGEIREREAEPGTAAGRLLMTSSRQGLCRVIELECLSAAECDELVAGLVPRASDNRELLDTVYRLSRGNPMFVRELVAEIRGPLQAGDVASGASTMETLADRVPWRVRVMAETQLASLDMTARRVVLLAAAAGAPEVSLADLRMGAAALDPPVGEGPLLDALDRALELRLLEESSVGYVFRHPLVRVALYGRLSRHRRAQLGEALHHR